IYSQTVTFAIKGNGVFLLILNKPHIADGACKCTAAFICSMCNFMQVKKNNLFFSKSNRLSGSTQLPDALLIFLQAIRWTVFILPVAITTGSAVAFFLWLLAKAIHFRFAHNWLLFLLPLAGVVIHLIYRSFGKSA